MKRGLLPDAVSRSKNPLVCNQGSSTGVVVAWATLVLERDLQNNKELANMRNLQVIQVNTQKM